MRHFVFKNAHNTRVTPAASDNSPRSMITWTPQDLLLYPAAADARHRLRRIDSVSHRVAHTRTRDASYSTAYTQALAAPSSFCHTALAPLPPPFPHKMQDSLLPSSSSCPCRAAPTHQQVHTLPTRARSSSTTSFPGACGPCRPLFFHTNT
jgi:hypothetical protein